MWGKKISIILAALVLSLTSVNNVYADLVLTLNGFNVANGTLKIEGKGELIIAVEGTTAVDANNYSVTVVAGGVLELITDLNSVSSKEQSGDYLFNFDYERGLAIVNLVAEQDIVIDGISVSAESIIYQLVISYFSETDTVVALGANLEAFAPPEPEPEQQVSSLQTTLSAADGSGTFLAGGAGDCNELLDPNWYPNLNNDSFVNFKDFDIFATNWLQSGSGFDGDINGSGAVDTNDLAILAYYWLANACGPSPEEVFESFKTALLADDVNEAVSYFAEVSAENYGLLLEQLRPYFTQMVNDMGELIFIRFDAKMAVYDLLREEGGNTYGYPVLFVRDEMGQWKIYDF